jgi:hypothetical protein
MKYFLCLTIGLLSEFILQAQSKTTVVFEYCQAKQALEILNQDDAYTRSWGLFDLQSRAGNQRGGKSDLLQKRKQSTKNWDAEYRKKVDLEWTKILQWMPETTIRFKLPAKILLIQSNMQDEGGAMGYTRENCIVLKEKVFEDDAPSLRKLLLHELFHVISRYNPELRKDLYHILGFSICNEIELSDSLRNIQIANPDAPFKDSYIRLKYQNETKEFMMFLYANRPYEGGSFFQYASVGLLEVYGNDSAKHVLRNSSILPLEVFPDFVDQTGNNTDYIIDPEEIAAEHFVLAILQQYEVPRPDLVRLFAERLMKK